MDPEKMLAEHPGSVVFARYAEGFAREGRFERAVDILKEGIEANPIYAPAYSILAGILFRMGAGEDAVANLQTAVKIDPQRPKDLLRLGEYYRAHDPEKAGTFLRTASLYEPNVLSPSPDEFANAIEEPSAGMDEARTEPSLAPEVVEAVPEVTIEGDAQPIDTERQEFFDEPVVQETEEAHDFYEVIGEFGAERPEKDLETVFEALDSEQAAEVPVPETSLEEAAEVPAPETPFGEGAELPAPGAAIEEAAEVPTPETAIEEAGSEVEAEGEEAEVAESSIGEAVSEEESEGEEAEVIDASLGEAVSEEETEGEGAEVIEDSGAVSPYTEAVGDTGLAEFGIEDTEKEGGENEKILEIDDEGGFDLSKYGFDTPDNDMPVLSDEEKAELIALSTAPDTEVQEPEPPAPIGSAAADEEETEVEDTLPVPPVEEEEALDEESPGSIAELYGALSTEELDVLSAVDGGHEDETGLSDETGEGIDYSDVLSEFGPRDTEEGVESDAAGREEEEIPAVEMQPEEVNPDAISPDMEKIPEEPDEPAGTGIDIPLTAGDAEISAGEEKSQAEPGEDGSLGNLIAAYERVLDEKTAPVSVQRLEDAPKTAEKTVEEAAGGGKPRPSSRAGEGYTATMAEIFVSQGLVSRAIEIYTALAGRDPGNVTYRDRLAELITTREQHPDA
jgi:pilus assembly protein FimV